jgi:hypothetical protein
MYKTSGGLYSTISTVSERPVGTIENIDESVKVPEEPTVQGRDPRY